MGVLAWIFAPRPGPDFRVTDLAVPDDVFHARVSRGDDRVGDVLGVASVTRIVGDVSRGNHADVSVGDPGIVV